METALKQTAVFHDMLGIISNLPMFGVSKCGHLELKSNEVVVCWALSEDKYDRFPCWVKHPPGKPETHAPQT
jgi:hypothetical protein